MVKSLLGLNRLLPSYLPSYLPSWLSTDESDAYQNFLAEVCLNDKKLLKIDLYTRIDFCQNAQSIVES